MSESEEECEDDIRRRQPVEDSEHVVSKDEDIEVVRMVTECLARYNNVAELIMQSLMTELTMEKMPPA